MSLSPQELHDSFRPSDDGQHFVVHAAETKHSDPAHLLAEIVLDRLVEGTVLGGERGYDEPLMRSILNQDQGGEDVLLTLWQGQQLAKTVEDLLYSNIAGEVQPPVTDDEQAALMKIKGTVDWHIQNRSDAEAQSMPGRA